jgi:hypothetical protein
MIVFSEHMWTRKEVVVAYFKILSRRLPMKTGENQDVTRLGYPVNLRKSDRLSPGCSNYPRHVESSVEC